METASLSWRRRNLYCRLFYDDSWASQVRFISPIFLLFPIGIQFLQRKSDTIKQSFKKSFPLRPVLLVVIIHDFLFLSVIPVKYLGFTQLWFYTTLKPSTVIRDLCEEFHSTMILHYSQTFTSKIKHLQQFHSTMILHYSQTGAEGSKIDTRFHSTMILHYSQTTQHTYLRT